jgi:inosine triphosphate pyrophosphatase
LESLGNDKLPKMLDGFEDKTGYAMTIYGFMEAADKEPVLFVGKTNGAIVLPRGEARFGWDPNFEVEGTNKT